MSDDKPAGDTLTLLELTTKQRETLLAALAAPDHRATGDHRVIGALRRRGLIDDKTDEITDLGRYQVRWYAEDAGAHWGIRGESFASYVARGAAPAPDGFEPRSTSARAYWYPDTVINYDRGPGRGNFDRIEIDMSTVIRQYRAGVSIRKIAKTLHVSPMTIAARLEEAGEKEVTSSSRTPYRHDQRASISAEGAG